MTVGARIPCGAIGNSHREPEFGVKWPFVTKFPMPPSRVVQAFPAETSRYAEFHRLWKDIQRQKDPGPFEAEFQSLLREREPEMFRAGLETLAWRLIDADRPEAAQLLFQALGIRPSELPAEMLLRRLSKEVCHPGTLLAMGIGATAFQTAKFATLGRLLGSPVAGFWTRGWGARVLAGTVGWLAEVPAFTLTADTWRSWNQAGDAKEGLGKQILGNALFFGIFKLGGVAGCRLTAALPDSETLTDGARALLGQGLGLAGLLLSRRLEIQIGLRPFETKDFDSAEIFVSWLQLTMTGHLAAELWSHPWKSHPLEPIPQPTLAAQTDVEMQGRSILPLRLVDALSKAPSRGTTEQVFTIDALERLYRYDAANTATGSWQNALWQSFLHEAVHDPNIFRAERALLGALSVFESSPDSRVLVQLALDFGYAKKWRISREKFPQLAEEIRRLAAQKKYPGSEVEAALRAIPYAPEGGLKLARLRNILLAGDVPGKIRELHADTRADTPSLLKELGGLGLAREEIVKRIVGTAHTAFLEDIRVARKVVSLYEEIMPYLFDPGLREPKFRKLQGDFARVRERHPDLGHEAFVEFLSLQHGAQAANLLRALRSGKLELRLLSPESFDDYVRENNLPASCSLAVYLKPRKPNLPSLIWLRTMPEADLPIDSEKVFFEFTNRIIALFHEFEHHRHFTGTFEPGEAASRPFDITKMSREDRLASETMAFLEQLRWSLQHLDDDFFQVARRLGENLAQFARGMADYGYFGE